MQLVMAALKRRSESAMSLYRSRYSGGAWWGEWVALKGT